MNRIRSVFTTNFWYGLLLRFTSKSELFGYYGYCKSSKRVSSFLDILDELYVGDYECKMLEDAFDEVDSDGSESLSIDEFLNYFGFTIVTPLCAKYFDCFDEDNNLTLDLREFIVAIWQLGTNSETAMIKFAFDLYVQEKGSDVRELRWEEAFGMLLDSYGGEKKMPSNVLRTVRELQQKYEDCVVDAYLDGEENVTMGMNKSTFVDFVQRHMSVFWPVLTLQREIKKKIVGEGFWTLKNEELDWLQGEDRRMKFSFLKKIVRGDGSDGDAVDVMETLCREREKRRVKRERRSKRWRTRVYHNDPTLWHQARDPDSGALFWHNTLTGASQWDTPDAVERLKALPPMIPDNVVNHVSDGVETASRAQMMERPRRRRSKRRVKIDTHSPSSTSSSSPSSSSFRKKRVIRRQLLATTSRTKKKVVVSVTGHGSSPSRGVSIGFKRRARVSPTERSRRAF